MTEEYRAITEVHDGVAEASRVTEKAEGSAGESRLEFEERTAEAQKALGDAARKLGAVHRDYPPR